MKTYNLNRLNLMRYLSFFAFCVTVGYACKFNKEQPVIEMDIWQVKDSLVSVIKEPIFPDQKFSILDFGAIGDGVQFNQEAFDKAISECSKNGGGSVIVPAGKYLTGAIHLDNNVNLHLEENAEILFSTDLNHYPIVHTSYEGTELMNFSPLIYANNKKNIAITGSGTLNGQGSNEHWWPWCGKEIYGWNEGDSKQHSSLEKLKTEMSEKGVPVKERVFGKGEFLRPTFIEPFECSNVLIQGIKIINAPFWIIHPFRSTEVIIDNVTVESHGPNNDGCDPEYSKNVIIKNCTFNTGDDCIAIKAGRNEEGRRVNIKSENIIIQNCKMIDGHGGVVIGSEMSAGVSNVFVENCVMSSPNLDRAIRIKTNTKRGGSVENFYARNIKVGQVKEAFLKINLFYGIYGDQTGSYMPQIRNINLENITVEDGGKYGFLIDGYESDPVKDLLFKDIDIKKVEIPYSIKGAKGVTFINTIVNGKQLDFKENI